MVQRLELIQTNAGLIQILDKPNKERAISTVKRMCLKTINYPFPGIS